MSKTEETAVEKEAKALAQAKKEAADTEALNRQAVEKEVKARREAEDAAYRKALEYQESLRPKLHTKEEFKKVMEAYKKANPVKYEMKKEALEAELAKLK